VFIEGFEVDQNVFFTGSGGTGKTLVLQHVLKFLSEKYQAAGDVIITAPTGIAGEVLGSWVHG
jgi:nucleoside-triphosphatase THEP1